MVDRGEIKLEKRKPQDKIWLIDQDGVIANFEQAFLEEYRHRYPKKPYIPLEKKSTFYVTEQYINQFEEGERPSLEELQDIYLSPGFYRSLSPIKGGKEALEEMRSMGEVFICTALLPQYENCVLEKYEWIEEHLGKEWTKKIIVAKDKTIINGDILIDDRPKIDGSNEPSWEHILYEQSYNSHINSKKRINWKNWKEKLNIR